MSESRPPSAFQFGMLTILALITIVAGILALLRPLQLPRFASGVLGGGAIAMATYVVFRLQYLIRRILHRHREMLRRRQEIHQWLDAKRRDLRHDASDGDRDISDADGDANGPATTNRPDSAL